MLTSIPESLVHKRRLAIGVIDDFVFGRCPHPVRCGRRLVLGGGDVVPEINFTLPTVDISDLTWPSIRDQYQEIVSTVCERAVQLNVPGLLVEFETLPPMTVRPAWGLEITRVISETLRSYHDLHGLANALRLTPNDTRDHIRPPLMRSGAYWDGMLEMFAGAAEAGADLISIESTGGKEICDSALMTGDIRTLVYALGVLAPRDMSYLWTEIVRTCRAGGMIPAGDTACGFANTAMVLAEQKLLPRVFAAVVRVAAVPRTLVAIESGAVGPSKDCAYEGPYLKAIAGIPISMEGRTAACAHLSAVGNIAQAVCDCWSNESVQNVRLLSASAPVVSLEQLAYDCRLLNTATKTSNAVAAQLRDLLVESDSAYDPQAYVLRPDVVLKLSQLIISEDTPYSRTRAAVLGTLRELRSATESGRLALPPIEMRWLKKLEKQAEALPDSETQFHDEMQAELADAPYIPAEYGF